MERLLRLCNMAAQIELELREAFEVAPTGAKTFSLMAKRDAGELVKSLNRLMAAIARAEETAALERRKLGEKE